MELGAKLAFMMGMGTTAAPRIVEALEDLATKRAPRRRVSVPAGVSRTELPRRLQPSGLEFRHQHLYPIGKSMYRLRFREFRQEELVSFLPKRRNIPEKGERLMKRIKDMTINAKLLVSLLVGLLVVVISVQIVQYVTIQAQISNLSKANFDLLKTKEEAFAMNIFRSVEAAVAGSLERGEMTEFTRLLENQKNIEGLLEFSLFGRSGRVTHSSDSSFLRKELPDDIKNRVAGSSEMILRWTRDSIEIYKPQQIDGDCIRCHTTWQMGEPGGTTYFSFSTETLNLAKDKAAAAISDMEDSIFLISIVSVLAIILVLSVLIYFMAGRIITSPLRNCIARLRDIAEGEGDLTKRLAIDTKDEMGELAYWFNTFVEKIQEIIKDVASSSETISSASGELTDISQQMSMGSERTTSSSNSVAAAAEQMNANLGFVSTTMTELSSSINSVALAVKEMTSSIDEIAGNSERARGITDSAVSHVGITSDRVAELGKSAKEIGDVTETISNFSEKTDLLALNATIEAARAGDAGKGFAVVANEIKELSKQTAEATEQISKKISGIQSLTQNTVSEIEQISKVIHEVDEIITMIAAAVEEQSVVTKEIADNAGQASHAAQEVTTNVSQCSEAAGGVAEEISDVNEGANEISGISSQLNTKAVEMLNLSRQLKEMVDKFKV
ncbi:MAG: methyl-accepting chemotaxis protein [Proteobacteria bacterium]|nr:methyl-accepting chemotaxis protein [Pseudomonadota bacterium]